MAPTTPMSATWMLTKTMSTPAANTAFDWVCRFHYPFCINYLINYSSQGTAEQTRLGKAICRSAHQPMGSAGMSPLNIAVYGDRTAGIQVPSQKVSWLLYAWSHYRFPRFRSRVFFSGLKKKTRGNLINWTSMPTAHMALVVLFLKMEYISHRCS